MKKYFLFALALALVSFVSLPAMADSLNDYTWHIFDFGGTGSQATPDFTLTGAGYIKVTDCCETGDQFTLYDNGVLLGTTNPVAVGPGDGCPDGDACYADPLYSHGFWAPGSSARSA
jgi:hypothetical protein